MEDSDTVDKLEPERKCLLCLKACAPSKVKAERPAVCLEVEEGGLLQKHLHQIFILTRILNVPLTWCEGALKRYSQEEEESRCGGGGEGIEGWFRVCESCTESVVKEAWELHRRILELQRRMEEVTVGVRERLGGEVRRRRHKREMETERQGGCRAIGIEEEIYGIVFPPLSTDEVQSCTEEEFTSVVKIECGTSLEESFMEETCSNYSLNLNLHHQDNDNGSSSDSSYIPSNIPQKRGRPPGPKNTKKLTKKKSPPLLPNQPKRPRGRPRRVFDKSLPKPPNPKHPPKKDCWHYCTLCPSKFRKPDILTSHLQAHSLSHEFKCPQCSYPALSSDELDRHTRIRHTSIGYHQPCPSCSFVGSVRKLKFHMLEHHPDLVNSSSSGALCPICSRWCANKQALSNHQKKMHPEQYGDKETNVRCNLCELIFPSRIRLQHHLRNTHLKVTKLICDICGKGFSRPKELQKHGLVHQKSAKGDFICAVCGLDFPYRASLSKHTLTFHKTDDDGGNGKVGGGQEFQCKYCEIKSPFRAVIVRHMKTTHVAQLGHKCDLCGKTYSNEQGLKRHLRINHPPEDEEPVKCVYCLKEFSHAEKVKTHQLKRCPMKQVGSRIGGGDGGGDGSVTISISTEEVTTTALL